MVDQKLYGMLLVNDVGPTNIAAVGSRPTLHKLDVQDDCLASISHNCLGQT